MLVFGTLFFFGETFPDGVLFFVTAGGFFRAGALAVAGFRVAGFVATGAFGPFVTGTGAVRVATRGLPPPSPYSIR